MTQPQTVGAINRVLRQKGTEWQVKAASPKNGEPLLLLYRRSKMAGKLIFVASLPRDAQAKTIVAFVPACQHYYERGQKNIRARARRKTKPVVKARPPVVYENPRDYMFFIRTPAEESYLNEARLLDADKIKVCGGFLRMHMSTGKMIYDQLMTRLVDGGYDGSEHVTPEGRMLGGLLQQFAMADDWSKAAKAKEKNRSEPMAKARLSLGKVYRLLEAGPVVLVSTLGPKGPNVMPMSWLTPMEFNPPLVGFVLSGRNYSFGLLDTLGECVINLPTVELLDKVVACGNVSGRRVNKFARFALTAAPSAKVQVPRVDDCYASLECKVVDRTLQDQYNFFIVRVVAAWQEKGVRNPRFLHHRGAGVFSTDGDPVQTNSRAL